MACPATPFASLSFPTLTSTHWPLSLSSFSDPASGPHIVNTYVGDIFHLLPQTPLLPCYVLSNHLLIKFGGTGISLINLLAGWQIAEASPDSGACTLGAKEYQFQLGCTTICLWELVESEFKMLDIHSDGHACNSTLDDHQKYQESKEVFSFSSITRGSSRCHPKFGSAEWRVRVRCWAKLFRGRSF